MFSPHRKGWFLSPRTGEENTKGSGFGFFGKGKSVVEAEKTPTEDHNLVEENGLDADGSGGGEALVQKIVKLESELYEYQYNMGLLLIEKKEWNSKYDEIHRGIIEAENTLAREHDAHLIAISEVEKQEGNLRKSLGIEKQFVADLEKALHEMRTELAEMKFTSDNKLTEAHTLMINVEGKSLEIDAKMCLADAKLVEIGRKSSELERELQELSIREGLLRREQASFNADKEVQMEDIGRQRDELCNWERSLREGQERVFASQNLLDQREKRANESGNILVKKERDFGLLRETLDKKDISLKEKEDFITMRLKDLSTKEKDADVKKEILEKKEKDLLEKEGKVIERERVEIQKLIDDHNTVLNSKRDEFEIEMEKKRKNVEEEIQEKLASLRKKETESSYKEENLLKREQAFEKEIAKLDDEVKDLDVKSKSLKNLEDAIKANEIQLEETSKNLAEDSRQLLAAKAEIDFKRKAIDTEKVHLLTAQENMRITEQERAEYVELQLKLKQEIDECRILKESLAKEREELKQERDNFEKEWEEVDEKRASLIADTKEFKHEKEMLEKWKYGEEEKMKVEQMIASGNIQNGLNDLKLKKEAFEGMMEHERSEIQEMLQRERADMSRKLDLQKHELEIDMQKKLEELENNFQENVSAFNEHRDKELDHISSLQDFVASEVRKMTAEHGRFEREKQDYITHRKRLEESQLEIQNDIEVLHVLNRNLKDQRDEFTKERECFLTLVKQCKTCGNCGCTIPEFDPHPSQFLNESGDCKNSLLSTPSSGYRNGHLNAKTVEMSPPGNGSQADISGGRMSWLRTCTTRIFRFSSGNKVEDSANRSPDRSTMLVMEVSRVETNDRLDDPLDTLKPHSDDNIVATSQNVDKSNNGVQTVVGKSITSSDRPNEVASLSSLLEDSSPNQLIEKKRQKHGRSKAIKRRTIVDKSKYTLEVTSEKENGVKETSDLLLSNKDSEGDSSPPDQLTTSVGHKRNFFQSSGTAPSNLDEDNEAHSESISLEGHRKRRQTVAPGMLAVKDKGYNFRPSTVMRTSPTRSQPSKGTKATKHPHSSSNELDEGEGTSRHQQSSRHDDEICMLPRNTTENIEKVHESSVWNLDQVGLGKQQTHDMELRPQNRGEWENVLGADAANSSPAVEDDRCRTPDWRADNNDDDEESDSEEYNASLSKKLWNFLTT